MAVKLTIVASILGLVSLVLYREGLDDTGLIFAVFSGLLLVSALISSIKAKGPSPHKRERKLLLNSALEIIDARTRLTIELVSKFRDNVKKYRYALSKEQNEFISQLLSSVGDVRINDTELESDTLSRDERKQFISENRIHLDKIEKDREVIEEYLSENT